MATHIYPYKFGSESARNLAHRMQLRRVRANGEFRGNFGGVVLNWGSSSYGAWHERFTQKGGVYINSPDAVSIAADKLKYFQHLKDSMVERAYYLPWFSTDKAEAADMMVDNMTIVERHMLRAHSGRGIRLVGPEHESELHDAPLYVQYVKKTSEYRVHVINGRVVDVAQKRVRAGSEGNNFQVRNHANGWVFAREGVDIPEDGKMAAIQAVGDLSLDFGAVDMLHNSHYNLWCPIEVNTAPGLVGTTLDNYVTEMRRLVDAIQS